MTTFLVAHGAWSAGFAWRKMHPLMEAAGHRLITPSYTGLGERAHLLSPEIDLDTHIADMMGVITYEDLRDFILIGHSYGGMVATGTAARAHDRIRHLVYLDAFVPRDGQCLFDLSAPAIREQQVARANDEGDGWRVPPNPLPPDTPAEDVAWLTERRGFHPLHALDRPIRYDEAKLTMPRSYIYALRNGPGDNFRKFLDRARSEPGWTAYEIDASHSPHITAPEALMDILAGIAGERR